MEDGSTIKAKPKGASLHRALPRGVVPPKFRKATTKRHFLARKLCVLCLLALDFI